MLFDIQSVLRRCIFWRSYINFPSKYTIGHKSIEPCNLLFSNRMGSLSKISVSHLQKWKVLIWVAKWATTPMKLTSSLGWHHQNQSGRSVWHWPPLSVWSCRSSCCSSSGLRGLDQTRRGQSWIWSLPMHPGLLWSTSWSSRHKYNMHVFP